MFGLARFFSVKKEFVPDGYAHVFKFNMNHEPAGSPNGGQFAKALGTMLAERLGEDGAESLKIKKEDLRALLDKLAKGDQHINIMGMTVDGKKLFGDEGLGIPRKEMPQLPAGALRRKFLEEVSTHGVDEESVDPATLKPVQDEIDGLKTGAIYKLIAGGKYKAEPIVVSKDNYIIDGHHNWAGRLTYRTLDDPKAKIDIWRVDMKVKPLLDAAQKFTDEENIKRKDITKAESFARVFKFNPNHEPAGSPKGGQFARGNTSDSGNRNISAAGTRASRLAQGPSGANPATGTGAAPSSYERGAGQLRAVIAGQPVSAVRWTPKPEDAKVLNARGIPTPGYLELQGENKAGAFYNALAAAKAANPAGAAVHLYKKSDYAGMKLFVTEDGKAGVAVKPDGDIVSVFNTPGGTRGIAFSALHIATQNGGSKLDAFDTVLPHIYSQAGFVAKARMHWDDQYAPEGWDTKTFSAFNKGRPDVVFMAYDPKNAKPYQPGDGKLVTNYDDAVALQTSKVTKGFASVFKFNPNHEPAGSSVGGRFAKASTSAGAEVTEPSLKPAKVEIPPEVTKAIEDFTKEHPVHDVHGAADLTEYLNKNYNKQMQAMMDSVGTDRRATILLHSGSAEQGIPTLWLLGWSANEGTDIHDHVESSAAITVVRGKVNERVFGFQTSDGQEELKESQSKDGIAVTTHERTMRENSTVTIGAPYIHEMWGTGEKERRDITVHGYYPPLEKMHYFVRHEGSDHLFYDGMWDEHGAPDTKVRKGSTSGCCAGQHEVHKFNPNHDELGRFATGPGGVSIHSLVGYAKQHGLESQTTADQLMAKLSPSERAEITLAVSRANAAPTTQSLYTDKDGHYTPERLALHQKIIDAYVNDARLKNAMPAPGEKPTLIVLGGRGGSGKSAFTNGTLQEFDASKFVTVDSDAIKAQLPEFKGWNAVQVHDESSHIESVIRSILLAKGANIISDKTLKTTGVESDIKQAIAAGYRIEGHYMFLPPQQAASRALSRYLGKGPGMRGRLVPPEVVLSMTKNEANFDSLKKYFSRWSEYDNSGSKPTLIERGGKGA
jgi:predicted ABC-type ATPase